MIKKVTMGILIVSCVFMLTGCDLDFLFSILSHDGGGNQAFDFNSMTVDEINTLIIGEWEWDHSVIMQRNLQPPDNLITPESAGYTMQRVFTSDGQVRYLKDEEDVSVHSWVIKKYKVLPGDTNEVTTITIDQGPLQLKFFTADSMMMGNGWLDGTDEFFVRK